MLNPLFTVMGYAAVEGGPPYHHYATLMFGGDWHESCGSGGSTPSGEATPPASPDCTPNEGKCDGNTLLRCDATGHWERYECSDSSCFASGYGPLVGCGYEEGWWCLCAPPDSFGAECAGYERSCNGDYLLACDGSGNWQWIACTDAACHAEGYGPSWGCGWVDEEGQYYCICG